MEIDSNVFLVFVIGIVVYLMLNQSCMVEGMEDVPECTTDNCNEHCMKLPTVCKCDPQCDHEDPECNFDGIPKCRRKDCKIQLSKKCSPANGVNDIADCLDCAVNNIHTLKEEGANCSVRDARELPEEAAKACLDMFPFNPMDKE
tara:strand:+ start:416 stop:850 length:435 start_codon:yes stop_codon:yes gene_type:complete